MKFGIWMVLDKETETLMELLQFRQRQMEQEDQQTDKNDQKFMTN